MKEDILVIELNIFVLDIYIYIYKEMCMCILVIEYNVLHFSLTRLGSEEK